MCLAKNQLTAQGESNLPEYQERAQGDEHLEGEVENDENDWDLDDAATEYTSQRHDAGTNRPESDVGEIIQTFVHDHPPPAYTAERPGIGQLPFPVIVPQRRPQNKSRGFVRAYAPVLSDCGIDQKTFIDFLESFDKASKVGSTSVTRAARDFHSRVVVMFSNNEFLN